MKRNQDIVSANNPQLSTDNNRDVGVSEKKSLSSIQLNDTANLPSGVTSIGSTPAAEKRILPANWFIYFQVLLVVILPVTLASIYYGYIATDRYVSSTQIVVQSNDTASIGGLTSLLGSPSLGGSGSSGSQGDILASYIHSPSILDQLESLLSLREIYSPTIGDQYSVLPNDASKEVFLEYYRDKTLVEWDASTGLLTIETQAFYPQDSKLILDTIIMLSEEKLNSLTERKQADRIAFAKTELELSEKRLFDARLKVAEFRRQYGEIDPIRSAEATGHLVASIQSQLAKERAELISLMFILKPTSAQVLSAKARIRALEQQVSDEKSRATNRKQDDAGAALSDLVTEYESLLIEEEFARATYTSALTFFENTRATAQQDSSYVVDFIPANMPDEATLPARLEIIASIFVVCLLILGIGKLIVAAIKEQARL